MTPKFYSIAIAKNLLVLATIFSLRIADYYLKFKIEIFFFKCEKKIEFEPVSKIWAGGSLLIMSGKKLL